MGLGRDEKWGKGCEVGPGLKGAEGEGGAGCLGKQPGGQNAGILWVHPKLKINKKNLRKATGQAIGEAGIKDGAEIAELVGGLLWGDPEPDPIGGSEELQIGLSVEIVGGEVKEEGGQLPVGELDKVNEIHKPF